MAIYVVTGKLGSGKSLCAVGRIREYLEQGRRVATNLDLRLEALLPVQNRSARVLRVPDKPTAGELDALGLGADTLEEDRYGLLVLDELGSWLNAREWADKSRQSLIDWLIHSRKRRWDILFIVQDVALLDKQVRVALMEFLVICKRMDRVRVPFFGGLVKLLSMGSLKGNFPKVHLAVVTYAGGANNPGQALVSDRWIYRGRDLYGGYDTEQVFSSTYAHGVYSYLTPWHVAGRYLPLSGWPLLVRQLRRWWAGERLGDRGALRVKLPLVGLLMGLSASERVRHWRRLDGLGAI